MTRKSKKVRDRAFCPRRRGKSSVFEAKKIIKDSQESGDCFVSKRNSIVGDLSSELFISKVGY